MRAQDRRKFPRIETDVTVEVYTSPLHTAEPEVAEICSVINLSECGMRFLAARRFDMKQLLRLTFLLPDSIIIIRTDARIIHLRKAGSDGCEVGVEFTNVSPSDRKVIRHYVAKHLETAPD